MGNVIAIITVRGQCILVNFVRFVTVTQLTTYKLEKAILGYLGQFSNPELVKQYLEAADRKGIERREVELHDVERQLADSEGGFLRRLDDLLKRRIINEAEFDRANQAERAKTAKLEERRTELKSWLEKERNKLSLAEQLPQSIDAFLEAFERLDPRQQKAQLQSILKAARVFRDGRIELEFRE
jgi:hypothetical protein